MRLPRKDKKMFSHYRKTHKIANRFWEVFIKYIEVYIVL